MLRQPPGPILFVTAKQPRKRKSVAERSATKRALDKARGRTMVNIGVAFERWRQLRHMKGLKRDAEVAVFLLDSYDGKTLPAKSSGKRVEDLPKERLGLHEEEERQPSMEIVVGIDDDEDEDGNEDDCKDGDEDDGDNIDDGGGDEDDCKDEDEGDDIDDDGGDEDDNTLSANSDSEVEQKDDTRHASDGDESSEDNSFNDDSSDEDYTPGLDAQKSKAVKVKKSLTVAVGNEAAKSEPGEQPPVTNNIQAKKPRKKFICPDCGKEFPNSTSLNRHLVIHSGKRPFKCFICGRGFTQSGNLKTHMKTHKGELHKWTLVQEKKQLPEAPVTANICGECGMDFPDKEQLEKHRESHKKPYPCPDCGKMFKSEKSVETHQRIHSGEYPCSICGRSCGTAQLLKNHMAIHSGQKNFHCHECGRSFVLYAYLKGHLNTHTGARPYLCSVCGKSYSRQDSLKCHLRVHTGERPYTCPKCGKGFRFSQTYQAHLKIHDKKPKPPTKPLGRPKQQPLVGNDQNVPQPVNT